ncbi:MAG: ATP-binding protein [Bacteroidales bacterium]|nr:ATP-binding protein [Bacteroidales bacterium]
MPQQHSRITHQAEPSDGHIRKLISQGEHQQLDFKFGINDSRKIARTLVAFANTDGGRLLIGVKDNGSIAGVRSEEEFYMVQAASELYTKPQVPFEVKEWTIDGRKVLEIIVQKSEGELYLAPDKNKQYLAYIRVKDENYTVNSVWIKAYKWKKNPAGVFIRYSQHEMTLLHFLEENPSITLTRYCKLTGLARREAENIVAGFLAIDMLGIIFSESGTSYSLSDKYLSMTPEERKTQILQVSSSKTKT